MRAMLLARVGVREQECIHAVEHALLQVMKPLHHNSPPKLSRGTKKKKKKRLVAAHRSTLVLQWLARMQHLVECAHDRALPP